MRLVGWKIIVVGEKAVGKTSLIRRFIYDTFEDDNKNEEKSGMYVKTLDYDKDGTREKIKLLIFDINNNDQNFIKIIKNSKGIMIVGDITNKDTLRSMERYASITQQVVGAKPMLFVGNKSDLRYKAEFWEDDLRKLAERFKASYIFTSARTNLNIQEAFRIIIDEILKRKPNED